MTTKRRLKASELVKVRVALLARQKNDKGVPTCPICDDPLTVADAVVDHDHRSGLVRDAMCRNCNGIEGKVWNLATRGRRGKPHKDYIGRMLKYWIRHETDRTGLYYPTYKTEDEKRIKANEKARKARALKKAGK